MKRKRGLVNLIKRDLSLLIGVGMLLISCWSAFTHYFGSYQGGLAWIQTARNSVKVMYDREVVQLKRQIQIHPMHAHLSTNWIGVFIQREGDWSLNNHQHMDFHLQSILSNDWLDKTSVRLQSLKTSGGVTQVIALGGKAYLTTAVLDESESGAQLSVSLISMDNQWLDRFKELTATEMMLTCPNMQTIHTLECKGQCNPDLGVSRMEKSTPDVWPSAMHQEIKLSSPYNGSFNEVHAGDLSFKAFTAEFPLYRSTEEAACSLWVMVPEDVMLQWPKRGILGIFAIGLVLYFLMLRRLKTLSSRYLSPLTEMINKVDQLRQDFGGESLETEEREGHDELKQLTFVLGLLKSQLLENEHLAGQLRQAQKLEAIGTLAGGIAHDFNNLMTVLLLNSETLREDFAELRAEMADQAQGDLSVDMLLDWSEQVEEMLTACSQAKVLTKQLLSISQDRRREQTTFSVSAACQDIQNLLKRLMSEAVVFEMSLPDQMICIKGSENGLKQALMNIVLNSRDAIEENGVIQLEVKGHIQSQQATLTAGCLMPGEYALITIRDNGSGIHKEIQERLFEPFFSSKGSKGTGLGLVVVYHTIVKEMRGAIQVESKLGEGSVFSVYLPLSKEMETIKEEITGPVLTPMNMQSIILVEDNEIVRKSLHNSLERVGFHVNSFSGGSEFVQWLERADAKKVDLILSDVVMPNMSGPELWVIIKETHPELPFLFITGYAGDIIERYQIPPEIVLSKPIPPQELRMKILDEIKRKSR